MAVDDVQEIEALAELGIAAGGQLQCEDDWLQQRVGRHTCSSRGRHPFQTAACVHACSRGGLLAVAGKGTTHCWQQ